MIEWIIQQQGVLSITLVFLLLSHGAITRKVGTTFAYRCWLLVPVTLLLNNVAKYLNPLAYLPKSSSDNVAHYVVNVDPISVDFAGHQTEAFWLFIVWLIGALLVVSIVTAQYFILRLSTGSYKNDFKDHCYCSSTVTYPLVLGVLSPKILLPGNFQQVYSPQQQQMILEHERVHIRHRDHVWNALALLLVLMFWFNPLIWIAMRSFRLSQELACDSAVLRTRSKQEKVLYAKALLICVENHRWEQSFLPSMGDKQTLLKRLHFIKQPVSVNRHFVAGLSFMLIVISTNIVLAGFEPEQASKIKINDIPPSKRVEPHYPQIAVNNQLEGSVILRFDINKKVLTDNIEVVQSFPEGIFDKSAVEALSQWEYQNDQQLNSNQELSGKFVQLDFRLYPRD